MTSGGVSKANVQDLSAHVALVTGASRGIGAAVALTLAESGAAVAVNYRERADDADAVVARIKAKGGRAIAVAADVSQAASVAKMVEQVTSSVRWEDSMRYLLAQGFTRFIELGPGKALSGFMKRIDKTVQVLHVADIKSLTCTLAALTS